MELTLVLPFFLSKESINTMAIYQLTFFPATPCFIFHKVTLIHASKLRPATTDFYSLRLDSTRYKSCAQLNHT